MCLTIRGIGIERKTRPRPKTANKSITVYKIVTKFGKDIISQYQRFEYKLGKVYTTKFGISANKIDQGLHAYRKEAIRCQITGYNRYHKVMECKIPKGAKYYIGRHGDIVSNKLKTIGLISRTELRLRGLPNNGYY